MATGTRATELLRRAGVPFTLHEYQAADRHGREREARPAYGAEAAAALGIAPARIFRTLVVDLDGRLVLAIVPVAGELDLKRLAEAAGARRADLAEPGRAERATGAVLGGISPIAPRRPLPAYLDASAAGADTIFVSAGRRGLQLEVAPEDLARVIGATLVPIARSR